MKALLRNEKENFANVVSPVVGFEEGIIDCEIFFVHFQCFIYFLLVIVHIVSKTYQTIHFDEIREILGGLSSI